MSYSIKLVIRTAFVILFGFLAIMFTSSGADARLRIMNTAHAQADARIALNYINDMLRTNDVIGRVEIVNQERTGRASLLIRHRTAAYEIDRWIYFEGGRLLEAQVEPGEQPGFDNEVIANLYDFQIIYDAERSAVNVYIYYEHSGAVRRIAMFIGMMSDRTDGVIIL